MAVAEYVTKLHAVCVVCGAPANHSQRLAGGTNRLVLGARETYEPRCRLCFEPALRPPPSLPPGAEPAAAPSPIASAAAQVRDATGAPPPV
jgi:thymidine kinase